MVSTPEIQGVTAQPLLRQLGSLQITGQMTNETSPNAPILIPKINDSSLMQLIDSLIPPGFKGKVYLNVTIVEIVDPPQESGATA